MSYTQLEDKRVDEKIEQELAVVRDAILEVATPVAIILFGGFGKGEGYAQIVGGEVILSKDYDILLVMKRKLSAAEMYRVSETIHRRLGRESNPLDSVSMEQYTGTSWVQLTQFAVNDLLYFQDVKSYEIKVASKLLWGEDVRERIPLRPEDLSPWNAVRFLMRKPPGMCSCLIWKFLKEPPTGQEKRTLIYECVRFYVDVGVLLTILAGTYRPTYGGRAAVIEETMTALPEIAGEIPDMAAKIRRFTDVKLSPGDEKYDAVADPVALWFETRRDLGVILRHFMERHVGEKTGGWAELFDTYTRHLNGEFVDGLGYFYLKNRLKIASRPLARLANIAYQRFFCLKYVVKLRQKTSTLLLRALGQFPTFRIGTAGLMLLFSLNRDGTLDGELFNSFYRSMRRIYPFTIEGGSDQERWDNAVEQYVLADRTFLDTFYGWG